MKNPNILFLDIEASNLSANFGFIICVGYQRLGESKVHCKSLLDYKGSFKQDCTNDLNLLKDISKVVNEADGLITWYGARFDMPYLQTRCLLQSLPPMKEPVHIDLWRTAKYMLKFNSNRLDTVARAIKEVHSEKTPVASEHWVRGSAGHKPSIGYIIDHCKADIKVLNEVYKQVAPFAKNLPNFSMLKGNRGCPNCGSQDCQKRGIRANHRTLQQQWQCKKCYQWFLSPLGRIKKDYGKE